MMVVYAMVCGIGRKPMNAHNNHNTPNQHDLRQNAFTWLSSRTQL